MRNGSRKGTDSSTLFWHRSDLRVADNVGLDAASRENPVIPVYVLDPEILKHASPPRTAFLLEALDSLRNNYRERESDLLIVEGHPQQVLPTLANEHDGECVAWNRGYSGLARRRERVVQEALIDAGLGYETYADTLHHEPGSITTTDGNVYAVFSYFWKKWRSREKTAPLEPPDSDDLAPTNGDTLPTLAALGFEDPEADIPAASTEAARRRLSRFCSGPIFEYDDHRDYPAAKGTSRLSVHLKWGTIGPRVVFAATEDALSTAETQSAHDSVETFQSQLAWREFYTHVLWGRPDVVHANYREFENEIEWKDDPVSFEAWKDGRTGYPIVDAGMRQLRTEAFMHNRVRMIVASFLTKDLLIDWRSGYDWFRRKLVDHDTANDSGGWQWAASTGTDAQPYFRIFNPMVQGERYDPDAEYIRTYVPELDGVPSDVIHEWNELDEETRSTYVSTYPDPIVDHAEQREKALTMFENARGE